jgi:hypothetical protein
MKLPRRKVTSRLRIKLAGLNLSYLSIFSSKTKNNFDLYSSLYVGWEGHKHHLTVLFL